jgi:hypothetical protein
MGFVDQKDLANFLHHFDSGTPVMTHHEEIVYEQRAECLLNWMVAHGFRKGIPNEVDGCDGSDCDYC